MSTHSIIHLSLPEFTQLLNEKNENKIENENELENKIETESGSKSNYDHKIKILKLNNSKCKSSDNLIYKIITYDKKMLNIDLFEKYGLYRSIIINIDNNVVGYGPPKSMLQGEFMKKYPIKTDEIIAEVFVEGTMINVFWNNKIGITGGWEISTKRNVGGDCYFFKTKNSKTFRTMFLEAAKENKLILENLNRDYSFSFVLQHPENRIVIPFKKPQLYLVAIYRIYNIKEVNKEVIIHNYNMRLFDKSIFNSTTIKFPDIYLFNQYSDLIDKYASMNSSYDIQGVIIYNNQTGERIKIRNPVYEQVKSLRGNQPKLQYQYISLRKQGKVCDFLKYYPEHKKDFSQFRDQIHKFTNTLFKNYVACYIKKEKPLCEFPEQHKTHMFNIHQIYINELKENKLFVTNTIVIHYVNEMLPSLLMYCLNFHMRKRNIDFIKDSV